MAIFREPILSTKKEALIYKTSRMVRVARLELRRRGLRLIVYAHGKNCPRENSSAPPLLLSPPNLSDLAGAPYLTEAVSSSSFK